MSKSLLERNLKLLLFYGLASQERLKYPNINFDNRYLLVNKNSFSVPKMIKDTFFPNPFEDYTVQRAQELITDKKPSENCKITAGLNDKWQKTLTRFGKHTIDYNDYSVYTGTSGIAYLKFKKDPDNEENLREVKQFLQLNKLKKRRHTFLCGDCGPLAIGAIVNYKLNKKEEMDTCIQKILALKEDVLNIESDLPNELMYGRAGYLYTLLYVNKYVSPSPFDDNLILQVIEAIFICGKNEARSGKFKCPLMFQWHESYYLGAAHGLSGILYLLLQARKYLTETELNTLIKPTIDYLITLRFPGGNFPSSLGRETDKYVQWCHGSPGFVYLFCTAYKVYGDAKYLQLAIECGDVIWERGLLKKGYSICHGVSGNAYCFLQLFQTTGEEKHLYRAIKFAEWCFDYTKSHEEHSPDRPLSMFEGISGPMYFLLDIQDPMNAKFPGFTL